MVSVVLVEPEHPGNVGAIARVMANFGFKDLVLINPIADYKSSEAIARSMHGREVLENIRVMNFDDLSEFDLLVATTAKLGNDYNLRRTPIYPDQLSEKVNGLDKKNKVAIVFGREGNGLSNDEIEKCDFLVTIPAAVEYPVLNLSHACSILCYEMYKYSDKEKKIFEIPNREEKNNITEKFDALMDALDFETEEKRTTQKRFWKKLISKSFLTKREMYILFGFLKRIKRKIDF